MDAPAIFQLRVRLLTRRLDALGVMIGSAKSSADWAKKAFQSEIAEQKKLPAPRDWAALQSRESSYDRLFQEGLAFLLAVRGPVMESDLQKMASALAEKLTQLSKLPPPPLIVPDLADSYSDFVPTIRLRFPAAGIWDVPIIAHEFGHYAAYRLTVADEGSIGRSQAFRELVDRYVLGQSEAERQKRTYWINEFFADMFATYMLGFAFAASLLLVRLDLSKPDRNTGMTHPGTADRAEAVLYALGRMNRDMKPNNNAEGPLLQPLTWLKQRWSELLATSRTDKAETGKTGTNESAGVFAVDKGAVYQVITSVAKDAIYSDWPEVNVQIARPDNEIKTFADIRDLLNGAWLRLTQTADEADVEEHALAWWRKQAGH